MLGLMAVFAVFQFASAQSKRSWTTVETENKPTARIENAFTTLDGKLYLLGGRRKDSIESYDPETGRWEKESDLPLEMHHFQARTYDGKIYVIGALNGGFPKEDPISKIYTFDPETKEWSVEGEIPEGRRRGAAGLALHDGKFYLIGGNTNGHYDGYVPWLDRYDPDTGEWTELPDAPHSRDHLQAGVVNGKIVVAGGRQTSAKTNEVFSRTVPATDVYDISEQSWTTAEEQIPTERAGTASIVVNGKYLVIGGESGNQDEGHAEVEAFDPSTMQWSSWPPLHNGRHGTQVTRYGGYLYIAAGSGGRGGGPALTSLERFPLK